MMNDPHTGGSRRQALKQTAAALLGGAMLSTHAAARTQQPSREQTAAQDGADTAARDGADTAPRSSSRSSDEPAPLFAFEDLNTDRTSSFAYWVLVEKVPLPERLLDPKLLRQWMSFHYDIEAQSAFNSHKEYLPKHFRIIAPVTLALRWTPFTMARELLGEPDHVDREERSYGGVVGIWKPQDLIEVPPAQDTEDKRHFLFLLRLASFLATEGKGRITIIGAPGWSWKHCQQKSFIVSRVALDMHKAGYLYTERVAR